MSKLTLHIPFYKKKKKKSYRKETSIIRKFVAGKIKRRGEKGKEKVFDSDFCSSRQEISLFFDSF